MYVQKPSSLGKLRGCPEGREVRTRELELDVECYEVDSEQVCMPV